MPTTTDRTADLISESSIDRSDHLTQRRERHALDISHGPAERFSDTLMKSGIPCPEVRCARGSTIVGHLTQRSQKCFVGSARLKHHYLRRTVSKGHLDQGFHLCPFQAP